MPAARHSDYVCHEPASRSNGATVQQVSADRGYGSVASFITMVKRALGKSPAKYFSDIALRAVRVGCWAVIEAFAGPQG